MSSTSLTEDCADPVGSVRAVLVAVEGVENPAESFVGVLEPVGKKPLARRLANRSIGIDCDEGCDVGVGCDCGNNV